MDHARIKKAVLAAKAPPGVKERALRAALLQGAQASSAAQGEFQNTPRNRIEQLTGKVWLESSSDSKKAVIFGIETAIDIERMINDRMTTNAVRAGKRPSTNLSPFEIGWTKAFKDVLIADIVKAVDDWYAAHPGNENRLVMEVIWDEIVTPRLGTGKTR